MQSRTFYTSPAKEWTEAQPLGNGSIGAMVFGKTDKEKICLNHDTLWSGMPKKITRGGAYDAFAETKKLALEGKYKEAHKAASDGFLGVNSEVYLPFGDMTLDFGEAGSISDYCRELDLEKALLTVSYISEGVSFRREYFISYPDDVMAVKISSDTQGKINFLLSLSSPLKSKPSVLGDMLVLDGECPGYTHADDPKNVIIPE